MIVDINNAEHGNSGSRWTWYALGKNNDREGAKLIYGDTEIGDSICESLSYKSGNYVRMVISFTDDDNVTPVEARKIVIEWAKEYMHGFKEREYHLDIVEHQDTKQLHYHLRIPKLNLLTQTQLKPYYHKADLSYKIAVNKFIAQKHNLVLGTDLKRLVLPPQEKQKRIARWRKEHEQELFDLSSKKSRAVAEEGLSDLINNLNMQDLVNSLNDVKAELIAMDFKIANEGYDRGKKFDYITIQQGDNKLRLKGEIYGERFYEHSREDRTKAIGNNRSLESRSKGDRGNRADVARALQKERAKRLKWIDKQYGAARKRAFQRIQEIQRSITKKLYQNEKDTSDVSSPSYSIGRNGHRNTGNALHHVSSRSIVKTRDVQIQDSQEKRRLDNDKARDEAIRRIRGIRKAKRAREEHIRAQLQDDSKKYNREVPTIDERDIRVKQGRTASLNSLITGIRQTAESDYRAIESATKARSVERGNSENFVTSVSIIRRGISKLFERVKQEFNQRTQNLVIGVGNVMKKRMLLETEKKNIVSQLRSINLNIKIRR